MPKFFEKLKKTPRYFDWEKLLYHEEVIGGLAIEDERIVLIYLVKSGKILKKGEDSGDGGELKIIFKKEIAVPAGIVENGILKNPGQLSFVLSEFLSKVKLPSRSVIVSLPSIAAQPFIFEFVPQLKIEEINNAISLIIDSSLPLPKEEVYTDWEEIKSPDFKKKKFLLAMGVKEFVSPYLESIINAGLTPVACETHGWSLGRIFNFKHPTLFVDFSRNQAVFYAYKNNVLVFQYNIPGNVENFFKISADACERIIHFLSSDPKYDFIIEKLLILASENDKNSFENELSPDIKKIVADFEFSGDIGQKVLAAAEDNLSKSFILSFGSALRGLISRSQDAISSLMPVGTESAYEYQRFVSFLDFFQKFTIALGGFFIVLFIGSLVLINLVSQSISKSIAKEQVGVSPEFAAIKESANLFNKNAASLSSVVKKSPYWDNLFSEVDKILIPGIVISNLSFAEEQTVSISGVAKTRDDLLKLRDNIEKSETFLPITLPLSMLITKENISFGFNLGLKNKDIVYKKF